MAQELILAGIKYKIMKKHKKLTIKKIFIRFFLIYYIFWIIRNYIREGHFYFISSFFLALIVSSLFALGFWGLIQTDDIKRKKNDNK